MISGAAARCVLFAIVLLAPVAAAAQLDREAPPATPHGFLGRMTVSPEHGPPGTPVQVLAEGLPADADFQLVWRTVKGRWKIAQAEYHGREYTPAAFEIATVRTDAAGRVAATFTVPEDFGFLHDVVLQQGERLFIQAGFSVDMSVRLSPPSRPAGTPATNRGAAAAAGARIADARHTRGGAALRRCRPAGHGKRAGFAPGKRYALAWTTVIGNRVGGHGWNEASRPVAEAVAASSGRVEFHFTAPDDLGGAHALSVENAAEQETGSLWIKPTAFPLDVDHGPAGTPFTVHLRGVGWTETANIYTVVYDNGYIGYVYAFNSQGDVKIPLLGTGDPGWHFIDLYPAIYRGEEQRPRNFLIPQLTYAADHPGEDLPRFRYAFEVTEE